MSTDRIRFRAKTPQRTCIGCRRTESWSVLVRVVAVREPATTAVVIVPDLHHRLPGRGAWLHPDSGCLAGAVRRRAFGRALRMPGTPDVSAVEAYLQTREPHHPPVVPYQQGGLDADEHPMSTQQ